MELLSFLILFPLLVAVVLLFVNAESLRSLIVKVSSAAIAIASVALAFKYFNHNAIFFPAQFGWVATVMFVLEMLLGAYLLYLSVKNKKNIVAALVVVQTALVAYLEFFGGHLFTDFNLYVDKFSIIMALIIAIIGTLICVFAVGYMKEFHHHYHNELKDKRNFFFFVFFAFLSAMFGIVFANHLGWLLFFWEITTVASFLLIGYKENNESMNNSFLALTFNLLGGIAFTLAIIYARTNLGIIELDKLIIAGKAGMLVPAVLIAFAGLTKAAQMPFSKWLLGAMVAPTPVSALLHSSTMVKAGVFIIIKLAPVLQGTTAGLIIALVGGLTFLSTSLIAVSQSDAKKVLAYSTIANLGLIVMCGGIGTGEAVWAAIMLIIFHAISKGLLFLSVGVAEHKIGSRNIEDMGTLAAKMPRLGVIMLIGMAGMFLAPFGMLVSKYAVLRALVDTSPLLSVLIAFGSAATLFFWVKWMGKILTVLSDPTEEKLENNVSRDEWFPLYSLAAATVLVCAFFPLMSSTFIAPYVDEVFGYITSIGSGNMVIMSCMMGLVMLFPLSFVFYNKDAKLVKAYMSGANAGDNYNFTDSFGNKRAYNVKNYYMENFFGESKLFNASAIIVTVVILLLFFVTK
jgi:ech hydrogenase subunit A